jgi:hypothetical protein
MSKTLRFTSFEPGSLPKPKISRMGYNPANFAYWIGEEPWVPGYAVYYAISFYDSVAQIESPRSDWWGPKTDPKKRSDSRSKFFGQRFLSLTIGDGRVTQM